RSRSGPPAVDLRPADLPGHQLRKADRATHHPAAYPDRPDGSEELAMPRLTRDQMARRVAAELRDGYYVNLGIGIPTLVANFLPPGIDVVLQSENGLLGIGPFPEEGDEDPDLINAGKQTITTLPGSAFFDSAMSFGMIIAGKVDLTVLGAMEVSERGDMDLVASAKNIIVAMMHTNPKGESKLLSRCTLPLTGTRCVKKIVTDLAVLDITDGGFKLVERAPGISIEEIKSKTEGKLIVDGEIPEIKFD